MALVHLGDYKDLKKHGTLQEVSFNASLFSGGKNFNTWLLFVTHECCFGVEVTMNNAAALYFRYQFGQSTSSAAAIASVFGWCVNDKLRLLWFDTNSFLLNSN